VAVGEVVRGFPVVEYFVAVLDWTVYSSENVAGEEDVKCCFGGELEWDFVLIRATGV
jgi:hypothetical protein